MRRLCLLIALFTICQNSAGQTIQLTGLHVKAKPETSMFTFNLTKKTSGRVHYFSIPQPRLILEFTHTSMRFNLPATTFNDANVSRLSVKKSLDDKLRFTFELKHGVKWKVYYQPQNQKNGTQLKLEVISSPEILKKEKALKKVFQHDLASIYTKIIQEIPFQTSIKSRFFTVVIDAGHGGKDSGARGKQGAQEKDVVLAIANLLAKKINKTAHMRAVLTRRGDYFVPLRKRLNLARKNNADVFIAIHADAYFDDNAFGASVYALSKRGATSEAARWLARRNNYAELGDVELNRLQDNSLLLRSVLIDLAQTTTIRDSLHLGSNVLDALDNMSALHLKRVQQAPFVVLKSPDIPSVLVETGFITNPHEEKRLQKLIYQEQLSSAIYQGIKQYFDHNSHS